MNLPTEIKETIKSEMIESVNRDIEFLSTAFDEIYESDVKKTTINYKNTLQDVKDHIRNISKNIRVLEFIEK